MIYRCTALQGNDQCILQAGHAGAHALDWASASGTPPPPFAPKKGRGVSQRALVLGLGGLLLALAAMSMLGRPQTPAAAANVVPPPWQPVGFSLTSDPTVAYQWVKDGQLDCDIADRCWGIIAVPKNGCSSLYVELAILDDAGTNVGYTNDVASGVAAGQQAKLVFDNFEDGASTARVSKVSCH